MGAAQSPSRVDLSSTMSIINESILKISNTTSNKTDVTQNLTATGGSNLIGNVQDVNITSNLTSIMKAVQTADFNTTLANQVAQDLEKKTQSAIGIFDGLMQNNNIDMKTAISNTLVNTNITEMALLCANNVSVRQNIAVSNGSNAINNTQSFSGNFLQTFSSVM